MAEAKANEIFQLPNDKKYSAYEKLVREMVKEADCEGLGALIHHFVQKEGNDQHGRTYITPELLDFTLKTLSDPEAEDGVDLEDLVPLMEKVAPMIREKGEEFPDALMSAVELLSSLYQEEEEWKKAAFAMSSFRFEKYRNCSAPPAKRVEWLVQTAMMWLECDETGSASQQIKKAHSLISQVKDNIPLVISFRTCYARVLDSERKFLDAALHYKKLSQMAGSGHIGEGDLMKTLEFAVTCAILAKAGPSRSRVLAMLYSDERAQHLHNAALLEKVFKERIIRESEVKQFEARLQPHQNADTASGMTVLQNAMTEHNMLAASNLYNNIKFDQLGVLLNIDPLKAEKLASNMIEQGRMNAVIDQIEGCVEFTGEAGQGNALATWDSQIQDLCLVVNHVIENVSKEHPKYKQFL